jgi:hypothetical protein
VSGVSSPGLFMRTGVRSRLRGSGGVMSTEPTPIIPHEIPTLVTIANDDGGLDIVAGGRVIATLDLVNVEEFSEVMYFDLDIRPRSYADSTDRGEVLRSWTRLRRSGSESVVTYHYPKESTS